MAVAAGCEVESEVFCEIAVVIGGKSMGQDVGRCFSAAAAALLALFAVRITALVSVNGRS